MPMILSEVIRLIDAFSTMDGLSSKWKLEVKVLEYAIRTRPAMIPKAIRLNLLLANILFSFSVNACIAAMFLPVLLTIV